MAEYLELERAADERHEFHDGEILAMSGGSLEYSLITANLVGEMRNALKGKPCRVAESNLRVGIPQPGRYVYPDALVYCGPPQFDPQDVDRHTLLNPRVIIEVLSPSTEAYDHGDALAQYPLGRYRRANRHDSTTGIRRKTSGAKPRTSVNPA